MLSKLSDLIPVTANQASEKKHQLIQVDKILLTYKNMPVLFLGNLVGAIPLTVVVWNSGVKTVSMVWLLIHMLVILIRASHYYFSRLQTASVEQIYRYNRWGTFFVSLAGLVWGASGIAFFDANDVPTYSFLILTLVCMVSGSMSSLASQRHAFPIFAMCTMLPIVGITLSQNVAFYYWMGSAALFYVVLTLIFHRNLYKAIDASLVLKYENSDLVENLKVQTEMAEKLNRDKSRFLASASHDLRQPLHAVNLFTEALENSDQTDQQRKILGHVRNGLDSMSELFDALLDISDMDANSTPVNKSHFHLQQLIEKLVERSGLDMSSKKVALSYRDCDHVLYSDSVLVERILGNLLSNAVRYTKQGQIEIFTSPGETGFLNMHVKDTGIGIQSDEIDNIFEEFRQLDNPERDRSKGLGLGLAIVRRLARQLEIPIEVTSKIGVGTEFKIRLPIGDKSLAYEQIGANNSLTNDLTGSSILIVDNEVEIISGMKEVLENWGCEVETCTSTSDALHFIRKGNRPDILISDFRMPGDLNGIELITAINQIVPDIPALVVSGDTGQELLQEVHRNKLILLHKPIKPVQLHIALMQLVKNYKEPNRPD